MSKPKIVFFDIETTPATVYTWDLYPNAISHDNIVNEWSIICAAYKELDSKTTKSLKVKEVGDDYELCKTLGEVLSDADIVVGHNIDKFDIPKLNARLCVHGLPPLPKLVTIDTLKKVKFAKFLSNRMDYLCKLLIGEGKMEVHYNLWLQVMAGSKKAISKMADYNVTDVVRNEQLYKRILPYMKQHPHIGAAFGGSKCNCAKCSSTKMQRRGFAITNSGTKYQRLQCQECGSWQQVSLNLIK